MSRCLFPFVLCLGVSTGPSAASPIAEVICAPSDQMTRKLVEQFGTARRATGLRSPEEVVEIWTDDQGDWTMIISYASGQSCIVAMGEHWQDLNQADPA